jgi:starch synthase
MPSEFEPCGLNQMYSLAYGTLPIIREVGGLKDTVIGIDTNALEATGFSFDKPSPKALLVCIRRAILLYLEQPDTYRLMQDRAMRTKFTWDKAAEEFAHLYEIALK